MLNIREEASSNHRRDEEPEKCLVGIAPQNLPGTGSLANKYSSG